MASAVSSSRTIDGNAALFRAAYAKGRNADPELHAAEAARRSDIGAASEEEYAVSVKRPEHRAAGDIRYARCASGADAW